MDNLISKCQEEISELKLIVERLIKDLGVKPISWDLQQKFNNFNNQHNTYIKATNDNSSINEILKFSRAVGLQASVLGSAIIQDKLIDVSQHKLAIQLRDSSNKFRNWVEAQFEFGSPYEETVNTEKLNEKQNRMLTSKKKDTLEEIIEDNYKLKGEIQELREKIGEKKFDKIDEFYQKQTSIEEEILTLKESEKKNIQLQYSYQFWEKQSNEYGNKFFKYGKIAVGSAVILILTMFLFLYFNPIEINTKVMNADLNISKEINDTQSKDNLTTINNNQIWIYGILILFSSIFVWFIRIMVKITLSNHHLSIDANERVIMIRTYLSLLKEGNGFDKDDKKVMLDNIFRPTNFGIIKDETKVTMMDILGSVNK